MEYDMAITLVVQDNSPFRPQRVPVNHVHPIVGIAAYTPQGWAALSLGSGDGHLDASVVMTDCGIECHIPTNGTFTFVPWHAVARVDVVAGP